MQAVAGDALMNPMTVPDTEAINGLDERKEAEAAKLRVKNQKNSFLS